MDAALSRGAVFFSQSFEQNVDNGAKKLFATCSMSLLAHLHIAHEQVRDGSVCDYAVVFDCCAQGHEEVGINLVPETAAES